MKKLREGGKERAQGRKRGKTVRREEVEEKQEHMTGRESFKRLREVLD